MDSFTIITSYFFASQGEDAVTTTTPVDEESGGGAGNSYCVVTWEILCLIIWPLNSLRSPLVEEVSPTVFYVVDLAHKDFRTTSTWLNSMTCTTDTISSSSPFRQYFLGLSSIMTSRIICAHHFVTIVHSYLLFSTFYFLNRCCLLLLVAAAGVRSTWCYQE